MLWIWLGQGGGPDFIRVIRPATTAKWWEPHENAPWISATVWPDMIHPWICLTAKQPEKGPFGELEKEKHLEIKTKVQVPFCKFRGVYAIQCIQYALPAYIHGYQGLDAAENADASSPPWHVCNIKLAAWIILKVPKFWSVHKKYQISFCEMLRTMILVAPWGVGHTLWWVWLLPNLPTRNPYNPRSNQSWASSTFITCMTMFVQYFVAFSQLDFCMHWRWLVIHLICL